MMKFYQDTLLCITSWVLRESCTERERERDPGPGSMHSEVLWPSKSCTMKYPDPGSPAEKGIKVRGVMHSEIS